MKLSVIVPAYNEEKLIGRCLTHVFEALRANASEDWSAEVIVVDNNSTDRTGELARAVGADGRFRADQPDLPGPQCRWPHGQRRIGFCSWMPIRVCTRRASTSCCDAFEKRQNAGRRLRSLAG